METTPQQDREAVETTLREFFTAMRSVELQCAKKLRAAHKGQLPIEQTTRECEAEILKVLSRFALLHGHPRRSGMFILGSDYDPEGEKVLHVEVSGNAAVVYTHQTTSPPFEKLVYLLREVDGQWRILDFRMRVLDDGGLTPWYL